VGLLHELLKNKIVLITGASSGIGRCIAYDFSKFQLKTLILIARNQSKLNETASSIKQKSFEILPISCDVSKKEEVKHLGKVIHDRYGYVDILVNNAGVGQFGSVEKISIEEIERVSFTNYFGMIYFTKTFLDSMIKRNTGHIINIASLAASFGIPGMAAYCGSKFAMLGFSESLNRELKETGIKVSVISPIGVKTNFFNNEYFDYKFPMKYMLNPEKVSKAVLSSIESGSFQICVPTIAGLSIPFKSCFPALTDLIITHKFRKI
jgi:short-subunit dehydrogenase